ncbi:MAG: ABC transporter permease [Prevotella sp.]|nr:ABC transporter permease [Prevotella sp.]
MRDILNEIWSTTKRNKLRTALTGFAVAWGIFMLIVLLGAGNGLINAQMVQSDRFLTNSMIVFDGVTDKPFKGLQKGRSIELNDGDLEITANDFAQTVDEVGARIRTPNNLAVSRGQDYFNGMLTGVYPNHTKIDKVEVLCGRFINNIDLKDKRKVMVLTDLQAKEFDKNYANLVGQYVKAGNIFFRVVGIVKGDENRQNTEVLVPYSTLKVMYGGGNKAGDIEMTFKGKNSEKKNELFEEQYRARINANHQAAPDDQTSIYFWNRYSDSIQMEQGISIIRKALWVVGLLTLLSGIVGVSNIMLITVKERTREFGIRKAIGAKPWFILKLIIIESVIITTVFGYVGMFLGVLANEYMNATLGSRQMDIGVAKFSIFVDPTVGLDVCFEATAVMVIAGTIAGLIPARKAAKIRPVEALRAE